MRCTLADPDTILTEASLAPSPETALRRRERALGAISVMISPEARVDRKPKSLPVYQTARNLWTLSSLGTSIDVRGSLFSFILLVIKSPEVFQWYFFGRFVAMAWVWKTWGLSFAWFKRCAFRFLLKIGRHMVLNDGVWCL